VIALKNTWKVADDCDSAFLEEANPEPLQSRKSMFVTGIHDLLSKADKSDLGSPFIAS
jgi:hypothetical protein